MAPRFVPDGGDNALLRLAHRIVHNLAVSELRRFRPTATSDDDPELAPIAPVSPADPLLRRAIDECRERLPGKPSLALTARLASAGAESDEALAERLGMKLNTFLQNFTRARRLLAECLEKHGVDLRLELR